MYIGTYMLGIYIRYQSLKHENRFNTGGCRPSGPGNDDFIQLCHLVVLYVKNLRSS